MVCDQDYPALRSNASSKVITEMQQFVFTMPLHSDRSFNQISLKKPLNAILVSDFHLSNDGNSYFSVQANKNTINFFPILVQELKPDQIFVLGDLFHGSQQNNQYVSRVMRLFSELEQEIFIIGGNHDEVLIAAQADAWPSATLHICLDLFLTYETDYDKIWFTHDGLNPYYLHNSEVPAFLTSLKHTYELDDHHWLITGHTHLPCLLGEVKVASLGCFNVDGHNQPLSYGVAKEIAHHISFQLQNAEELYFRCSLELG